MLLMEHDWCSYQKETLGYSYTHRKKYVEIRIILPQTKVLSETRRRLEASFLLWSPLTKPEPDNTLVLDFWPLEL